jgi:hypothetical protein
MLRRLFWEWLSPGGLPGLQNRWRVALRAAVGSTPIHSRLLLSGCSSSSSDPHEDIYNLKLKKRKRMSYDLYRYRCHHLTGFQSLSY